MLETWGIVYQPDILTIIGLIVNVITAPTFVVQIIGPICVKLAITRAGEVGQADRGKEAWASDGVIER